MKGLMRMEYAALLRLLSPSGQRPPLWEGGQLEEASDRLVEQGRAVLVPEPHDSDFEAIYQITPAGREALKLWPLLVERGLVAETA